MKNISAQNHAVYSNHDEVFQSEKAVLKHLKDYIKEDSKILESGVGTGKTTKLLHQLSLNYVRIDYSEPESQAKQLKECGLVTMF